MAPCLWCCCSYLVNFQEHNKSAGLQCEGSERPNSSYEDEWMGRVKRLSKGIVVGVRRKVEREMVDEWRV